MSDALVRELFKFARKLKREATEASKRAEKNWKRCENPDDIDDAILGSVFADSARAIELGGVSGEIEKILKKHGHMDIEHIEKSIEKQVNSPEFRKVLEEIERRDV